jgi:pantetheine-phosphate adenylyltransferase
MKYMTVATGGTFDHLHRGHLALLSRSFDVADHVVIGVTSDELAVNEGKKPDLSYSQRVSQLERYLRRSFPGKRFTIAKLDDYFGPGIASPEIQAIVVSAETASRVPIANGLRAAKGYPPLDVIVVDYVLADDGRPISSTRIRKGEIDTEGRTRRRNA